MPFRLALPLAAVLALAACEADAPTTPPDGPPDRAASADGALPDTAMVRETTPEATASLVDDLADASPSVAIQTVDLWIARLDTVSAGGAADVRDDLRTLRSLLQSSPLDGPAIGRTLRRLGDGTAALADAGTPLSRLAQALRRQGGRLAPDTTEFGTAPEPGPVQ